MNMPLFADGCGIRIAIGDDPDTLGDLAGLRVSEWSLHQPLVDVTSPSDGCWRRLLSQSGIRSIEVRASGLFLGSASERRLRDLALSGAVAMYELPVEETRVLRGEFVVTSLRYSSRHDDEATYEVALASAGPVSIL